MLSRGVAFQETSIAGVSFGPGFESLVSFGPSLGAVTSFDDDSVLKDQRCDEFIARCDPEPDVKREDRICAVAPTGCNEIAWRKAKNMLLSGELCLHCKYRGRVYTIKLTKPCKGKNHQDKSCSEKYPGFPSLSSKRKSSPPTIPKTRYQMKLFQ